MAVFLSLMIVVVLLPSLVSQQQRETLVTVLTGQTAGSSWDTTTMDGRSDHRMLKKRRKRQHVNVDQLLSEFSDGTTSNPDRSGSSAAKQQVSSATEGTAVPLPMMTSGQALTPTPLISSTLTQLLSNPTQTSSFDASKVVPTPAPLTSGALSGYSGAYTTTTGKPVVLTPVPILVPPIEPPIPITVAYPPELSALKTYSPYVSSSMTSTSRPIITGQPVTTMPWNSINKPPTQSLGGTTGTTSGAMPMVLRPISPKAKQPLTARTSSPTYYLTLIPTPSPTYSPTLIPTPSPTHRPTLAPVSPPKSDAPTYYPTATAIPTPS
jgi:hypothetical protein